MSKTTRKLRIQTKNKQYEITDCPLYKLGSKNRLSHLLGCELAALKQLVSDKNYNCFIENNGKKPREIQQPTFSLDRVHTRIASLLCRIRTVDYLHSGKKHHSHITNAKAHLQQSPVITTDIKAFYESTKKRNVFIFFSRKLKCSPDVSNLLAEICTYNDHIPTGSRISMPLAYWSNERMFNELKALSASKDITMTILVDDLTFSGDKVNKRVLSQIKKIIRRYNHTPHKDKTRLYPKNSIKVITGTAIKDGEMLICNKHHKSIFQDLSIWEASKDGQRIDSLVNRLSGRLEAQSMIDKRLKDKARSIRNYVPPQTDQS